MANESALRSRICELLREHRFMAQPIESETAPGIPDLFYQRTRVISGWLELKKLKSLPVRSTTSLFKSANHGLSIEQVNWIDLCMRHGGRADILVGYERDYFLVPGKHAEQFNDYTWDQLQMFKVAKAAIPNKLILGV